MTSRLGGAKRGYFSYKPEEGDAVGVEEEAFEEEVAGEFVAVEFGLVFSLRCFGDDDSAGDGRLILVRRGDVGLPVDVFLAGDEVPRGRLRGTRPDARRADGPFLGEGRFPRVRFLIGSRYVG